MAQTPPIIDKANEHSCHDGHKQSKNKHSFSSIKAAFSEKAFVALEEIGLMPIPRTSILNQIKLFRPSA